MDPQAIIENFRRNVMEHYFDMKGRVGRPEFWYFVLAGFVVQLAAGIIGSFVPLIASLVSLGLLLPYAGMGARRLQDTGKNGQLVWLLIVPSAFYQVIALLAVAAGPLGAAGFLLFFLSIGWLISLCLLIAAVAMIYFWVQPGQTEANEFGPVPPVFDPAAPPAKAT
jgi:uncharacterized membrane protein YhaH (DUF805 family)